MKKQLLLLVFTFLTIALGAQVIYDFETPQTSTEFQNFGSSLEGVLSATIANPNPTGINQSANVVENVKPAGSETWAGCFTNPSPTVPIAATSGGSICLDAHFDHIGTVSMKLEAPTTGGDNWLSTVANTTMGEWEQICFPFSALSEEGAADPATGKSYGQLVLFFDFGVSPTEDITTYFDNILLMEGTPGGDTDVTVLDWETPATTTTLFYFGSSIADTPANNIANPNPTGVNTSATVVEYIKPANSEVWAGAYCDPAPTLNVMTGISVCIDVHMDHIGNVALKLEASTTGGQDWILQMPNTVMNQWETICYDLTAASIEGDPLPATGNIYGQLVLFPDFGTAFTDDQTYYIDNVRVLSGETMLMPSDVAFSVDMNNYSGSFTTVYVSGGFNNWSGDAYPLNDDDADGIWTGTYTIDPGSYEFKFTLDNWAAEEQFNGTEACVAVFDDGNGMVFINRTIVVTEDVTLDSYCFNSCFSCGGGVNITFNIGVPGADPSGVYLAGGAEFGAPGGAYLMTDDDNDGVYSITIQRAAGYEGFYTFANGNCPDYSCKENIAGQSCANPDNFNDRYLDAVTADTEINTCFAECTTDTNCGTVTTTMVTFRVDMSEETISSEGIRIAGQFSNWGDVDMTDADSDGVYEVTIELNKALYEYKFKNGVEGWENLEPNTSCTITTDDGMFTNRLIDLTNAADDELVDRVCFESCVGCLVNTNDLQVDDNLMKVFPTVTNDVVNIEVLKAYQSGVINVIAMNGAIIQTIQLNDNNRNTSINIADLNTGMYLVTLTTDEFISTQKVFKN